MGLITRCYKTAVLLLPGRGVEYCDQPVCPCVCVFVCVCLSASISLESLNRSARNFVCRSPVAVRLGPPTAALRYVMYFRFMDDVMFGRNGCEAGKGWQHSASAINCVRDRGGV